MLLKANLVLCGLQKRCGDGLPACNCPGFRCAGCPGCPGTPFRGSCLPNNIVFGCAQPQCDPDPVCKKGQVILIFNVQYSLPNIWYS